MSDTPDTAAHSALPWAYEDDGNIVSIFGTAKNGDDWTICDMGLPVDLAGMNVDNLSDRILDEREANAAFIVRACNNHYQLVSALREAIEELWDRDHSSMDRIQFERANASLFAALSQAGGE